MTFFFDNNFSPDIPRILVALDVEATHLKEHFPPETPDVDWIPVIGRRGWVLITADRDIKRNAAERTALKQANIVAFFFGKWYLRRQKWDQATWITKYWRTLQEEASKAKAGTLYDVNSKCKFTRKWI